MPDPSLVAFVFVFALAFACAVNGALARMKADAIARQRKSDWQRKASRRLSDN